MAAGVVGDHAVPGALQRRGAHHDVAVRGGEAVQQHDRGCPRPPRRRAARPGAGIGRVRTLDGMTVIDVTESDFDARGPRALATTSPSSSTSGPSGAGRAARSRRCSSSETTRARGQGRAGQARHRRQPGIWPAASASRASRRSRRFATAASSTSSSARSRPRPSSASSTASCPPRPTSSSRAGDEASLRRALELEPGRADAAVALAGLLHGRGEARRGARARSSTCPELPGRRPAPRGSALEQRRRPRPRRGLRGAGRRRRPSAASSC